MAGKFKKLTGWQKRKARVSKKLRANVERMRLNVYRSNKHIYAQLIHDLEGKTICVASTMAKGLKKETSKMNKTDAARKVGECIGKLAKEKGVDRIVFDRSGYLYHGRIKALAEGLRSTGLNF